MPAIAGPEFDRDRAAARQHQQQSHHAALLRREQTGVGEVYMRSLMRAQLRLGRFYAEQQVNDAGDDAGRRLLFGGADGGAR